jgi:indole-3-glycerol phosphate synthase
MILDELVAVTQKRLERLKALNSSEELKKKAFEFEKENKFSFAKSLRQKELSFICEVKKASPSKGVISGDFPYMDIARDYEEAGAAAVSVLTEEQYFLGSDKIFTDIRKNITLPMIRKDFTISEYQIYEAKLMGADAILLIVSILDFEQIKSFLKLCKALGLDALVETHDEREINTALEAGADIIGVNNRNLKNFNVDFENILRLRELIPAESICVAESGVRGIEDIRVLREAKVDAVLIGELLMRSENKRKLLKSCRGIDE